MAESAQATGDIPSIVADLRRVFSEFAPTPLLDLPGLAKELGVAQVLAKNEACRPLGSFKSLGGTYAGLRALARAAGTDIAGLLAKRHAGLPALICASDGNHGLAVAAAARFAGAEAVIFLPESISQARVHRIEAQGARIVQVAGSYDDAVDEAAKTAGAGAGIQVSDTVNRADDPIVRDVMAGYEVIAAEVRDQIAAQGHSRPTHLFVQAGVGGLAAAVARTLYDWMAAPATIVVVEPEKAACVTAALSRGEVVRLPGDVSTAAEMLSCGEASVPAFEILKRLGVQCVSVSESELAEVPGFIMAHGGPRTTPSGGAAVAGLRKALTTNPTHFGLTVESRVLVVISERDLD
jgi:diaminopropionate ammonia-lyase